MTKKIFVIFFISLTLNICHSQEQDYLKNPINASISKPSILSTHPFGIFISRIQGNFKFKPYNKPSISINIESGNVWGTPIKTYIPNSKSVRDNVRQYPWHQAQYFFNTEELDAKTFEIQIDGVIKGLRAHTSINLANNQEINVGFRMFALTKGKLPFSSLTSDNFIESFHKNIAGGNDPFDRGVFGHNKANIKYADRNGNDLKLESNDIIFGGIESSYYFYPKKLFSSTFSSNIGAHLGLNFSNYNKSLDFGVSLNALKIYQISTFNYFQVGIGIGALRKNLANLKSNNVEFGTNKHLANLETAFTYNYISKNNNKHTFGFDYYLQTSLNKRDEINYAILIRHPNAHNSWGHGVTNLYKTNNYWSFFYSFTKRAITTIYLQQDFQVNNNPDIQTGINVSFFIN